jgi:5-(carboxyamino)imidazole ribonucleotide synthase
MTSKTIGILGGGQLGRMSAIAAANLGITVVTYSPDQHGPASQVSSKHISASYSDESALRAFAEEVDVVTYEFENVPIKCAAFLEQIKPVFPKKNALEGR